MEPTRNSGTITVYSVLQKLTDDYDTPDSPAAEATTLRKTVMRSKYTRNSRGLKKERILAPIAEIAKEGEDDD